MEQDPLRCRGIILGMDPYPNYATGIPFEDPAFRQMSNKNIASHIQGIYGIDSSTGCNLYEMARSEKLFLMNASLTLPVTGKKESGAHYDIWEQFTTELLSYVITASDNFKFILLFGKDKHLDSLADHLLNITTSKAIKITSFHPCTRYFLQPNSNAMQEINAYMRLMCEQPVLWFKALQNRIPSSEYYDEVKEIEVSVSIGKLVSYCNDIDIDVLPLDDFNSALGDSDIHLTKYIVEHSNLISGLYKLYNHSFDNYKSTIESLRSNKSDVVEALPPKGLENAICCYMYDKNVTIYVMFVHTVNKMNQLYHRSISHFVIDYYFKKKFKDKISCGHFDMSVRDQDYVPLNAYECIIDILASKTLNYNHSEMIRQLSEKAVEGVNNFKPKPIQVKTKQGFDAITPTGYKLKVIPVDNEELYFSPMYLNKPNGYSYASKIYLIRRLSSSKSVTKTISIRGQIDPIFLVSLYMTTDYKYSKTKAINSKRKDGMRIIRKYQDDILNMVEQNKSSIFDLALCCVGRITKIKVMSLTEDLVIVSDNPIVVKSSNLESAIHTKKILLDSLLDRYDEALSTKSIDTTISKLNQEIDEMNDALSVVEVTNQIYKLLYGQQ